MKKKQSFLFQLFLIVTCIHLCYNTVWASDECNDNFDMKLCEELELIDPIDPKTILVCTLKEIIKGPLWEKTTIPNGRDALYLIPYKIASLQRGGIALNLFFNDTHRMPVTLSEMFNAQGIETTIKNVANILSTSSNAQEIAEVMPLLRKMILQERKIGTLLQIGLSRGPFMFQLHTSLLAAERNFWLSKTDRNLIQEIVTKVFPDFQTLEEAEFIKTKYGLGDTRFKLGLNFINQRHFQADIGFESIIPTSRISSSTEHRMVGAKNGHTDISEDFSQILYNLLKSTQNALLDPKLGNRGHFGFGIFFESRINLLDNHLTLWNRLSLDNLLSAKEDRLILFKKTMEPSNLTEENLSIFFSQYIFPSAFRVSVKPGSIVNAIFGLDVQAGSHRIGIGYDFYSQQEEHFNQIHQPMIDETVLQSDRATATWAMQHKIFTEGLYTKKGTHLDWNLGIGADATIARRKIGKDWTIYVKGEILF